MNIKNYLSNLNNLINKVIFKLMINVSRVEIKIIDFITFSLLFYDKIAKVELLIENQIYLRYIYNDVVIIDKFIDVCDDNRDNNT